MKNKKGFTLLELLVVVLIIGILAAAAMPQYRRAVEKARSSEAITTLKSIEESVYRILYAENPLEQITFDDLDIEFATASNQDYSTEYFDYVLVGDVDSQNYLEIAALRNNNLYELDIIVEILGTGEIKSLRYCYPLNTDVGEHICKSLQSQGWAFCESTLSCTPA